MVEEKQVVGIIPPNSDWAAKDKNLKNGMEKMKMWSLLRTTREVSLRSFLSSCHS
jgi:hypothetical protein